MKGCLLSARFLTPELIHLLRFESNSCFLPTLPTEGQASMIFAFAKVAEKGTGKEHRKKNAAFHCTVWLTFFFTKHYGLMADISTEKLHVLSD